MHVHSKTATAATVALLLAAQTVNAGRIAYHAPRVRATVPSPTRDLAMAFDSLFANAINPSMHTATRAAPQQVQHGVAAYDLTETNTQFTLSIDVPGCGTQDVKVTLEEGGEVLNIRAVRPTRGARTAGTRIQQRIGLSRDIETAGIKASVTNGVLTVTLPKLAKPKAVEIPVMMESAWSSEKQQLPTEQTEELHAAAEQSAVHDEAQADAAHQAHEEQQQQQQQPASWQWSVEEAQPDADEPCAPQEACTTESEAPSPASIENTHISIAP